MKRRALSLAVAALMVVPLFVLIGARPAVAAVTAGEDRLRQTPTSWWTYVNVTPSFLSGRLSANGARLTDIEIVQTSSGPLFTATLVRNAGDYATSWWWYYNKTISQLTALLSANGARLIDLEPYDVGGGTIRYAAVMVANPASPNVNHKSWWWYANVTSSRVSSTLSANGARLIDFDSYLVGGVRKYFVVMIQNTGTDLRTWYYYYGRTGPQVSALLSGKRLISLDRRSDGLFDVIGDWNGDGVFRWWWYYNKTISDLTARALQLGARIIDIESYTLSGETRYSAVMVNNLAGLNATLRNAVWAAIPNGSWGFYLKRVSGAALAAHQHARRFEPASAIKALIHLHAMLKQQLGSSADSDAVTRRTGYTGSCPSGGFTSTTEGNADLLMMKNSDNQMTDALLRSFGKSNVLSTGDLIGMTRTEINHTLGCLTFDLPHNLTTLVDLSKITEVQMNGSLLNPTYRDKFHDREINETWSGFDPFYCAIVNQEATALGLSASVAQQFCDAMIFNGKGGSYTLNNDATYQTIWRSDAGRMSLPFKSGGAIAYQHYAYGHFIDNVKIKRTSGSETPIQTARDNMVRAMWRGEINSALQTWS